MSPFWTMKMKPLLPVSSDWCLKLTPQWSFALSDCLSQSQANHQCHPKVWKGSSPMTVLGDVPAAGLGELAQMERPALCTSHRPPPEDQAGLAAAPGQRQAQVRAQTGLAAEPP